MDSNLLSGLLGAAATGLIGGIGELIRRKITRASEAERIAELRQLAGIATAMKDNEITYGELQALRLFAVHSKLPDLDGQLAAAKTPIDTQSLAADEQPITQAGMSAAAGEALRDAEGNLAAALAEIDRYLSFEEVQELASAQKKWDEFKVAHADFVSKLFEGGSMQPMWWVTAIEIATIDRTRELQAYLEVRKLSSPSSD